MRIKPLENHVKNRYDSIFKIATQSFVNALIPLTDLPEDDYIIISSQIFKPGHDAKSMDILLKGKKGYVNIEFHKKELSKHSLDRDFEYAVECYIFYGETIDQRIIVIDNEKRSVEKLKIMPDLDYKAKYYFIPEIDGATILNNIKNKIKNNQKPDEYEQYIFSILPLTDHSYDNEKELIIELCNLTRKLNIIEKNKEAIALCQMIYIDIFIKEDENLKNELMDVITMTSSFIEKRENKLKNAAKIAEQKANKAEQQIQEEKQKTKEAQQKVDYSNKLLKEIAQNIDEKGKLNQTTIKKILAITSKI